MSETRQRTKQVAVRFTAAEYEVLELATKRTGLTAPEYIRRAVRDLTDPVRIALGIADPIRVSATDPGENKDGAARVPALTAPDRTPLSKQEVG